MTRVLVVQNGPRGGPKRFGDWLTEPGADGGNGVDVGAGGPLALDVVHAYDGAPLPARLTHGALVVLGGGLMPDDHARAPWLRRTRELVDQALEAAVPVFGICLAGSCWPRPRAAPYGRSTASRRSAARR